MTKQAKHIAKGRFNWRRLPNYSRRAFMTGFEAGYSDASKGYSELWDNSAIKEWRDGYHDGEYAHLSLTREA